ncbi:efflux RND transporter permease subunit [Halosimplex amylolyticum]|uniref:efflux RND transporter permease subunit n=1 Tax=Halosimplex amylolyticum TaxID=3396616 RepID=UPI003F54D83A
MSLADRYAGFVTDHSKLVIATVIVATLVVGSGAGDIDSELSIASFSSDSTEADKLAYVESNFTTEGENTTVTQVVVTGDDTLTRASLLETLRFQRTLLANSTVNDTLRERQPIVGLSNVVATAAIQRDGGGDRGRPGPPSLDAQIEQLSSMSEEEVRTVVAAVLDPDRSGTGPVDPYTLLPTEYEAGSTTASGRIVFVFHDTGGADELPPDVVDAQLAVDALAGDAITETGSFVFGSAIVDEESGQATGESFAIISPAALVLVLLVLGIAYRDVLDVLLGLVGVVLVLAWMGGVMGWAGIGLTQILIAVPFLLIGLSIDYALHVVMRYREAQVEAPDRSPRAAMRRGVAGVVVAIGAATVTTAVGFASNLVSPIQSIQEFAIVSAAGILSAFVVFGVLLPPLKMEIEELLERVGFTRRKRPFGQRGPAARLLGAGTVLAQRAPVIVLAVAVVLSAGGAAAATDIDTSIDQVDFLPRDSPAWMDSLPESFQPGDYDVRANAIYLNEQFVQSRAQSRAEFLVEGPVTDPGTLDRLAEGRRSLSNASTAVTLADGGLRVTGPGETIQRVAADNESVASVVDRADTDGDGIPDEDLEAVYDAVYAAAPEEAAAVFYRTDGDYRALRVSVALRGGANTGTVTEEMRGVAAVVETDSDLTVTATGQPVVQELVQRSLLDTLVTGFAITFGVIVLFLTLIFRRRYRTLSLGSVVMLPVVLAQAWVFGTMYLAGISFNTETAIIASIGIGIGVDYSIHIGERFVEERRRRGDRGLALRETLQGTGGALLASAVSTAGGFGVLMLALVPSLQRFGFLTATAIGYAFVASVLVLPSLLVLWDRYVGLPAAEPV